MLSSLFSGVSGLQQMQQRMDVIGNNIANVNTTGFKGARSTFEDAFSQNLLSPTMQVGTGVTAGEIRNEFRQGAPLSTGEKTHLAITGEGFFTVRDVVDSEIYATRAGDFKRDVDNYLITPGGMRVQGFSDSGLSTRGDILIDRTGAPATAAAGASVSDFTIDEQGRIIVQLDDGTEFVRGQVLLQNVRDTTALLKEGSNLYSGLQNAGALTQSEAPGSYGLGGVQAGSLEMSNVDVTNEFASLITSQRAFQASARIVTTSDEVLQEAINLKR
jgi:flagellar hook protein FlgE